MNKNRKMVLLFSVLSALVVTTTSLSLAWYSEEISGIVDGIEISLRSDPEIYISTSSDLDSFKSNLTKDDLNQVSSFTPVTSAYSSNWLNEYATTPRFNLGYRDNIWSPIGSGYFSQELYLFSKDDLYVTLDVTDDIFVPDAEKNAIKAKTLINSEDEYFGDTEEEITENLNNIVKSLRVSILNPDPNDYHYWIIDPFKQTETAFANIVDSDLDGYYDYHYVGNELYEEVYGNVEDTTKLVFDDAVDYDITTTGYLTCFNAAHNKNTKRFNFSASQANGAGIEIENSISTAEAGSIVFELRDMKPVKFVLSIYLEGWDLDNTNYAMYASFFANIKFKIKGDILE